MRPRFPLSVRDARVDDAPELADLWHRSAQLTTVGGDDSSLWHRPDAAEAAEALEHQLGQPHRSIWVGEHSGRIVTAAAASMGTVTPVTTTKALVLTDLVVDPELRRQGVARQMLTHLAEVAGDAECEIVIAVVPGSAREPSRYLAKLGFSPAASIRAISGSALRSRLNKPIDRSSPARRAVAARRSMRRRSDGTAP